MPSVRLSVSKSASINLANTPNKSFKVRPRKMRGALVKVSSPAGDETFTKAPRIFRGLTLKLLFGVFAKFIEALLETDNLTDGISDNEGRQNNDDFFHDLTEAAIDRLPCRFHPDPDRRDAENEFDSIFNPGRKLARGRQTDNPAEENGADIENGSEHWRTQDSRQIVELPCWKRGC